MRSGNLPNRKDSQGDSQGNNSLLISSREIIRRINIPGEEYMGEFKHISTVRVAHKLLCIQRKFTITTDKYFLMYEDSRACEVWHQYPEMERRMRREVTELPYVMTVTL